MQSILLLPRPLLVFGAVLFISLCLMTALLILRWGHRFSGNNGSNIPVPAFMGVVATAWALSLGFAASDLWTLGNRADHAVAAERSSVMRLLGVAMPPALDLPDLYGNVIRYVQLVEDNETSGRFDGSFGTPAVDAAIQDIRVAVIEIANSAIPEAVVAKIVNDFDELQDARNDRLGISLSLIDPSKWYLLISFTFLTTVTVALLHIDRPAAGRIASLIFSITALAGLWILVIHIDPLSDVQEDYLSNNLGVIALMKVRNNYLADTDKAILGHNAPLRLSKEYSNVVDDIKTID